VLELLTEAAGRATSAAPLAYVTFEPRQAPPRWSGVFELRMSVWPDGGADRVLATAAGHGVPVRWSL
jgi:hypothetical protein